MLQLPLRCVVFLLTIYLSDAYNILTIFPLPSKSHEILGDAMAKQLSESGHKVWYMSPFVNKKPIPGVTFIDISNNVDYEKEGPMNLKDVMDKDKNVNSLSNFLPMMLNISRSILENPNVQELMADKNIHFDVVIAEWLYIDVYAGFAAVFNCPFIWFSTVEPHWKILELIDDMPNPAYTVDLLSTSIPPLTFTNRIKELGFQVFGKLIDTFILSPSENEQYEKFLVPFIRNRQSSIPTLESLKYNASIMLSNSHVSMGTPMRLPPNLISIGGYHIEPTVKPLPKDLQNLMDNAKHGVIYFSMGSSLRSKHFPEEIKQDLLKMFGKLKQTVLWKFEEDLSNRPSNLHILPWAPQKSILAHKNCVLFITHGGLLSATEVIHFGVPTIGIPAYADQFLNVERAVKKGFAKRVELSYSLAEDLKDAIDDILSDPKYTLKAKEFSQIYHDRSVHPAKELVHWVEHVVKTNGAPHLRSPALTMAWYQKLYIDLILVIIIIAIALKYISRFLYRLIKTKLRNAHKQKIN